MFEWWNLYRRYWYKLYMRLYQYAFGYTGIRCEQGISVLFNYRNFLPLYNRHGNSVMNAYISYIYCNENELNAKRMNYKNRDKKSLKQINLKTINECKRRELSYITCLFVQWQLAKYLIIKRPDNILFFSGNIWLVIRTLLLWTL